MKNQEFLTSEVVNEIASELKVGANQVENTLKLILDDCTVPFIARYRKETTGSLDEVQIRDVRDKFEYAVALIERKDAILRSIEEQGKLTPALKNKISMCKVKSQLEDLYLPFKPKKRSRGQIARERGLEPLALEILAQDPSLTDVIALATTYVLKHEDVKTVEHALQGAKDYIAELISELPEVRGEVRQWTYENALFKSVVRDEYKDKRTKFNDYYDFSEPVKSVAAHRMMALRRGEKEEIIRVSLDFDNEIPLGIIYSHIVKPSASDAVKAIVRECVQDAYTRLVSPSIETELRLETRGKAELEAIHVFSKNLKNLLLLPPIPKRVVMGVDPGIRSGSKLVIVDTSGKLLDHTTVFPDFDSPITSPKNQTALEKFLNFKKQHNPDYIAIGNGTGGREMEQFVELGLEKLGDKKTRIVVINESGASVYSASDVAREEFPDLDLTFRGSVSIARRLQDPLAELVKIDPKSIGIGQYQHDVNQGKLKKSLEDVVESCVNYVGVNLNTASPSLLGYVAGIGPTLARNIVRHRETVGEFKSRQSLIDVMGFGPKVFEQAAGFIRVPESTNPLDNTAVHPERYSIVEKAARDLNIEVANLIGQRDVIEKIKLENYVTSEIGLPTLQDIIKELLKPGRDPREEGVKHSYSREVKDFSQLKEDQVLMGTVTNVTNFGAFVDIGVHQDGLVHISELSYKFITNLSDAIAVGQQVRVKVIAIDRERKRISLSMKALEEAPKTVPVMPSNERRGASATQTQTHTQTARPPQHNQSARPQGQYNTSSGRPSAPQQYQGNKKPEPRKEEKAPDKASSVDELLAKFNGRRL